MKLPVYAPSAACVKCGEKKISVSYATTKVEIRTGNEKRDMHPARKVEGEILICSCSRCQFVWYALPLDHSEPAP